MGSCHGDRPAEPPSEGGSVAARQILGWKREIWGNAEGKRAAGRRQRHGLTALLPPHPPLSPRHPPQGHCGDIKVVFPPFSSLL